jgi:hypothetical protein
VRQRLALLIVALWAGALVTVCALVAPTLFALLPDRHLAGSVAAAFFRAAAWLGVGAATLVIALRAKMSRGPEWLLVGITALAPVSSELLLRPCMDAAQLAGDSGRFALLHGVAGVLFAIACVTALALVWRLTRQEG